MAPGCACGEGLTTEAAELMGLMAGTPVASSIIDAHAGGIGKFLPVILSLSNKYVAHAYMHLSIYA